MILSTRLRRTLAAATALGFAAMAYPVAAQEISASHLRAARAAISAMGSTEGFDLILPEAAIELKNTLISNNPDLVTLINETVDEQAIALAPRRADLEREAALTYARNFTEDELNQLAEFYSSPAGRKLLEVGPEMTQEVFRAAEIWQNGIARDLSQNVGNALQQQVDRDIDTDVELNLETPQQQ